LAIIAGRWSGLPAKTKFTYSRSPKFDTRNASGRMARTWRVSFFVRLFDALAVWSIRNDVPPDCWYDGPPAAPGSPTGDHMADQLRFVLLQVLQNRRLIGTPVFVGLTLVAPL